MGVPPATGIGPKKIKDLLRDCRGYQQDIDGSRGDMGQMIGQAVEKEGLDRKVFAWIRKLDKMEPDKLARFMETFDDYYVKSGLKTRAESAPSMKLEKTENEADEEVQEEASGEDGEEIEGEGNVTPIKPRAARKPKNGASLPH